MFYFVEFNRDVYKRQAYTGRKKAGWETKDPGNKKALSLKIKITGYGLIRSGFNAQSVL